MNAKEMQSITAASRARTGNPIITEIRALRPGDTAALSDNYGDGEHTFTLIATRPGDAPGIETLFFVHNPGSTSDAAGFVFEMDRATDGDFQDQIDFAATDLYDALDPYGTEYVYTDAEALKASHAVICELINQPRLIPGQMRQYALGARFGLYVRSNHITF